MSAPWRQTRERGERRKVEVAQTRIDPAFADRMDAASLILGEPQSEFLRRAAADRCELAERLAQQRSTNPTTHPEHNS